MYEHKGSRCATGTKAIRSGGFSGTLETGDVDLLHLEHRLHRPIRLRSVLIAEQLAKGVRDDLPGQAELVGEPPALALLSAAGEELLPVVIDFLLVLALHEKGDGRGELEDRAGVQDHELLSHELEGG